MTVTSEMKPQRVIAAKDQAAFRNFAHAGARIRLDERASIIKSGEPSLPGQPPHTRGKRGHSFKFAFQFHATKEDVEIGPVATIVGDVGQVLEFGGRRGDQEIEARPFALPALEKNIDRFAQDWAGSIGG